MALLTLVLTGPRRGQTVALRGRQFIDGEFTSYFPEENVEGVCHYMAICYGAYPEGSPEVSEDGKHDDKKDDARVHGEYRPPREKPAEKTSGDRPKDSKVKAGKKTKQPKGPGKGKIDDGELSVPPSSKSS